MGDPTGDAEMQDFEPVYKVLGIRRSNGQDIETRLSNRYSNCLHQDIVSLFIFLVAHLDNEAFREDYFD